MTALPEGRGWNRRTFAEQFAAQVRITAGCWIWMGRPGNHGYGRLRRRDGTTTTEVLAHRYSYERFVGPISAGLTIDHLCRNRLCVNPSHLEVTTRAENTKREWAAVGQTILDSRRDRTTHCLRGHPYDDENTYASPSSPNKRACKACKRDRDRRRRRVG